MVYFLTTGSGNERPESGSPLQLVDYSLHALVWTSNAGRSRPSSSKRQPSWLKFQCFTVPCSLPLSLSSMIHSAGWKLICISSFFFAVFTLDGLVSLVTDRAPSYFLATVGAAHPSEMSFNQTAVAAPMSPYGRKLGYEENYWHLFQHTADACNYQTYARSCSQYSASRPFVQQKYTSIPIVQFLTSSNPEQRTVSKEKSHCLQLCTCRPEPYPFLHLTNILAIEKDCSPRIVANAGWLLEEHISRNNILKYEQWTESKSGKSTTSTNLAQKIIL